MTTDQAFNHTLLYLRAAGHDSDVETRARLRRFLRAHQNQFSSPDIAMLLKKLPQWFDLPGQSPEALSPPIVRTSVGYPDA